MSTAARRRPPPRFQIGDVIETPRRGYWHVGLVVGRSQDGGIAVLTGTPARGTHLTTLRQFAAGKSIRISDRKGRAVQHAQIQRRMRRVLGRRYSTLNWNCEHIVRYALGTEPERPQIQGWITAGVAISAICLAVAATNRGT